MADKTIRWDLNPVSDATANDYYASITSPSLAICNLQPYLVVLDIDFDERARPEIVRTIPSGSVFEALSLDSRRGAASCSAAGEGFSRTDSSECPFSLEVPVGEDSGTCLPSKAASFSSSVYRSGARNTATHNVFAIIIIVINAIKQ